MKTIGQNLQDLQDDVTGLALKYKFILLSPVKSR